jgi:hypothetical protein
LTQHGKDALIEAVQHARHAVSIEIHPFSLTTLGTILFVQLSEDATMNEAIYTEAFGRLSEAIDRERNWSHRNPHSFMSLLNGTKRYIDFGGKITSRQKEYLQRTISEARRLFPRNTDMAETISQIGI